MLNTISFITAAAKQLAAVLMKYHKEEITDIVRRNIKIPIIAGRTFQYIPKKDKSHILLFLQSIENEVSSGISNFSLDTGILLNDIMENAILAEVREEFIEPVIYNIPEASDKLTEEIINLLPEKEKRLYKAAEQFLFFLETLIYDPEPKRLKSIEKIIENNVRFYIIKSAKKKKQKPYETYIKQNSKEPETPEEILKEIGIKLQNTNALRDKSFNLRMLKGKTFKINKRDMFFYDFTTKIIIKLMSRIPDREKSVRKLWKKAFKKRMSEYYHYIYKDEFQGYPMPHNLIYKRTQERFYIEIHSLTSAMKKLKKQFPFTERGKWIKQFKEAEEQYVNLVERYAEFIHIAYVLKELNVITAIPKMPGWISLLSNLYKELKKYEKRTEYLPEKIERKILKAEKSEKEEILTLF